MYGRHPASRVFAMESMSWPLMPKSHSLMLPVLSSNILDGFTSTKNTSICNQLEQSNTVKDLLLLHPQTLQSTSANAFIAHNNVVFSLKNAFVCRMH